MRPLRSVIAATAAAALVVFVAGVAGALAATTVVDWRGHLLSVEIVVSPHDPASHGLGILDVAGEGAPPTTQLLGQTFDAIPDIGPQMGIDPSGDPVLLWSRWDGIDFELAMTRRLPDGTWDLLDLVTDNFTNDVEPRFLVDGSGTARVLWWTQGADDHVYLQGFDTETGEPTGSPEKPFEPTLRLSGRIFSATEGGGDDPGVTGGNKSRASAGPCLENPRAAPEHGVLLSCGRAAAYQLSSCILIVGVYDPDDLQWRQEGQDLSNVDLSPSSGTTARGLAQQIADARCY